MMREVAESETDIKFKVIEKGGQTIEKLLSKPNPLLRWVVDMVIVRDVNKKGD